MSADQFIESLSGLLPQGYAWPRDPGSVLMAVIRSEAAELSAHTEAVHAAVRQWQPSTTVARLAEWEASCGLPDACFPSAAVSTRRASLLRTLRGHALPLADSSPASPVSIGQICADVGYPGAVVTYNTPMRAGMRVGRQLGALDGRLHITVPVQSRPLRVGQHVGQRLVTRNVADADLNCYLLRVLPARFSPNVIFA